jgi:hypothetical protein
MPPVNFDDNNLRFVSHPYLTGASRKDSVFYQDKYYMIKFSSPIVEKRHPLMGSYSQSPISEYIGSHIFQQSGIPTHNTVFGIYKDSPVVLCEDFVLNGNNDYALYEFSTLEKSHYSSNNSESIHKYLSYEHLTDVINNHWRLSNVRNEAIQRYWDTFVVDALVANFDRHGGNFGFLIHTQTGEAKLAPVYDLGSSLYPNLDDRKGYIITDSSEEMNKRLNFPSTSLRVNDEKTYFHHFITSLESEECNAAVLRIVPKINMDNIVNLIQNAPTISNERKEFLSKVIPFRYQNILEPAYESLYFRTR